MENIYSVLATAITVLGGASAWRFYEKRADRKEKDEEFIRHDCRDRIAKLEALLQKASEEKDELRNQIIKLVSEVAKLQTQVKYLNDTNKDTK